MMTATPARTTKQKPAQAGTPSPRQAATHLWKLGANITAIPAGGKNPGHKWKRWEDERQPEAFLSSVKWRTKVEWHNGEEYQPIETVGVICGIDDWRWFDVDARKDADGTKIAVPDAVCATLLAELGLPADYPWCGRSTSGKGWHIAVRCAGELPAAIAAASSDAKAADGGGAGVKVGIPLPDFADAFDHIELRWELCQTVLPGPTGYNGHLPDAAPAEVTVDQIEAAFLAVATPKPPKGKPTTPPSGTRASVSAAHERFDVDAACRALDVAFDTVDWFSAEYHADTEDAPGGEIRVLDQQGLLVKEDRQTWYTFGDEVGGGWAKAVAFTRFGGKVPSGADYIELVRVAADFACVTLQPEPTPRHSPTPAPAPAVPPTRTIHWGTDIDAITLPRALVKGYLNVGTVALFIGPSEAGKSTIAVDVACKVAQHYSVIYVAGEDAGNVRTQIRAWELTGTRSRGRLGLRDTPLLLADPAQVDAFIAEAAPHAPRLVVIDTLSTCTPGIDENSSEMTVPVAQLNRIADVLGAAVLVLHHPTKSDGGQYRGHSSILNNTHTMWIAKRDGGDDLVILTVDRHKGKKADNAALRLVIRQTDITDPDEGTLSAPVALPAGRVMQTDSYLSPRERAILHYLDDLDVDGGATNTEVCKAIAAECKVAESRVRIDLASLVKRGLISPPGKQGSPRQITDKGRSLIKSDQADQADQVVSGDPFVINAKLGELTKLDRDVIRTGATFTPQQDAVNTGCVQQLDHLIALDRNFIDQVDQDPNKLDHLIRSFRSDQVIKLGDDSGDQVIPPPSPVAQAVGASRFDVQPPSSMSPQQAAHAVPVAPVITLPAAAPFATPDAVQEMVDSLPTAWAEVQAVALAAGLSPRSFLTPVWDGTAGAARKVIAQRIIESR